VRPAAAVLALLGALAVLVWSPGSGSAGSVSHDPRLATPASDVLRRARGTLWWVDGNCRVEFLRLRTGARAGAGGHCKIWPAPSGHLALAGPNDSTPPHPAGNLELLADGLHPAAAIGVRADALSPAVAWAPDGSAVAFCVTRGRRPAVVTLHLNASGGGSAPELRIGRPAVGRCQPTFTFDGQLATSDGRHVFLGATRLPVDDALRQLAGGGQLDVVVRAMAASPAGLVLAVGRREPPDGEGRMLLVTVRRDGAVVRIDHPPPGLIDAIGVSPDGAWLSAEYAGGTRLISLDASRRRAAVPAVMRGVAWSPDGRLVAVALAGELRIVDLHTGRSTSITDADPVSVSWTL
jgi:hypothetical protein